MFRPIFTLLVLALASAPAAAETIESQYTSFDTKTCRHQKGRAAEDGGSWLCPGYRQLGVRLAAGDQRMYVSYGNASKDDPARAQTFPGHNSVYQGTVEWRLEKQADGKLYPFATILRWNIVTDADRERATGPIAPSGRVLVVTRLGPGGVCHVGYVDAKANPDANALARRIADEHARAFKCGKDKRIVLGKSGEVSMPPDGN